MSLSETEVVRVAARGDGVTADGRHVPFAAPGDYLTENGELRRGPHHQEPPCRHFPRCGGCQLQHLDDDAWRRFLSDRVAAALAAQRIETEIRAPHLSPPRTRRRATLHAERRGRQVRIGFTESGTHKLIDLAECHILAPDLFALLAPLRRLFATLLPDARRVNVHLAQSDQGRDVLVDGIDPDGLAAAEAITGFAAEHALARFAVDEGFGATARWEPEPVTVTLGDVAVPMPSGSFLQATPEGEAALVACVRDVVGGARNVADLFAGLGTFTFALAGSRVYAGEAARDAILSLKAAASAAGRTVFADHRDLFRRPLTAKELGNFDAVVLDPPRAGAREQVAEIAASKVPLIAYVSCNPSTFARDAQVLCEAGYRLDWVQPVGQFRWSTHVELAALFSR
ncbi:class I SAM-dependent RNA methyltransferase [Sphingomonas sp. RS6]